MRVRSRRSLVMVALLAAGLFIPPGVSAASCQFVLGFATVAQLVPQVGQCLEDQHYAANGDAQQHTTGGLLAWRKADNWTAFTDGYRTWINGPYGVQQRLNTQRFTWESDSPSNPVPASISPASAPSPASSGCYVVAGSICLPASAGMAAAISLLASIHYPPLLVAAGKGATARFGSLGPLTLGAYYPATNQVVIDVRIPLYGDRVLAAVLSHELEHATQGAFGLLGPGSTCYNNEFFAFSYEGEVWAELWGYQLPEPRNEVEAQLNDLASSGFNESRMAKYLVAYGHQCGNS